MSKIMRTFAAEILITYSLMTTALTHSAAAEVAAATNYEKVINAFTAAQANVCEASRSTYSRALLQFFNFLKAEGKAAAAPTRVDVVNYKNFLLTAVQPNGERYSSLTVCSYLNAVRLFFQWAEGEGLYSNIARNIRSPKHTNKHRKQHLTKEKVAELLNFYRESGKADALRNFALVNLLVRTGLRTAEAVSANIEDIAFIGGRRVLYIQGKGHTEKDAYIVLTDKAYFPLRDYLATRVTSPKQPLFISNSNHKAKTATGESSSRLTTRSVRGIVREGLDFIGLDSEDFTAHSLRHTTAVAILAAGGGVDEVRVQLRHASTNTSLIYVQSYTEDSRLNSVSSLLDSVF